MPARFASLLLVLLACFALMLGAAMATDNKPPGKKGSDTRIKWCDNVYKGCVQLNCEPLALPSQLTDCTKQCQTMRDTCNKLFTGGVLGAIDGVPQSAGVLEDEGDGLQLTTVVLDRLGEKRLAGLCADIKHAIFTTQPDGSFGCLNPFCLEHRFCSIVCVGGDCTGFMPGRPDGALTPLAVLQNGDPVIHTGPLPDPPRNNTGHAAPKPDDAPPGGPPGGPGFL